jgi:hypothetical protein
MVTEDAQKKSRSDEDYVNIMQDQSLEQMEARSLKSEEDSTPSVQAPSPKRPKKLKVKKQEENLKKGEEEAEQGYPPLKHNTSDRTPLPCNEKIGYVLQDRNSKH